MSERRSWNELRDETLASPEAGRLTTLPESVSSWARPCGSAERPWR